MTHKQMVEAFQIINQQLRLLEQQMDILNMRIHLLELKDAPSVQNFQVGCHVCGVGSDGVMAYACPRTDCPQRVTCVNPQDGF